MKKWPIVIPVFLAALGCVFLRPAQAAPCYGPHLPQKGGWHCGAGTYVVFDRDLEDHFGALRSGQNFFLLSYGIFDWLSLDLKGGAGNIKQHPVGADEIDYPSSFAGGYGLRARLYDHYGWSCVLGFQHISVHPRGVYVEGVRHRAILDDWQVSCLSGYRLGRFGPYAGARWSRMDYIHWQEDARKRRMSDLNDFAGFFTGCDIFLCDKAWINIEGQFFDAKALAVSFNISF